MEILAGLSVVLLVASALVISIKTLALWRRSRQVPELLLSGMLLSATVIGYPLAVACNQIPATQMWPIHVAYPLAFCVGYACLLGFTLNVFRPGVPWAIGLVGVCLLMLVGCTVAYIAEAIGENPKPPAELVGLSFFNSAPIAIAYLWTTCESLGYHRRLRLQLRLGLTDGVVVNRVLLWALMSLAAGIAVIINAGSMLVGLFMSPLIVSISSVLGIAHASCLFLAFHPPDWYKAWLERSYAPGDA